MVHGVISYISETVGYEYIQGNGSTVWASNLACSERRSKAQEWLYFGAWRWCIFFAGMGPVYFLAELLVHVLFLTAESHFFTLRYAFYYAVSVKVGGPLS